MTRRIAYRSVRQSETWRPMGCILAVRCREYFKAIGCAYRIASTSCQIPAFRVRTAPTVAAIPCSRIGISSCRALIRTTEAWVIWRRSSTKPRTRSCGKTAAPLDRRFCTQRSAPENPNRPICGTSSSLYTVGSLAHAMYKRRGLAYTMFAVRAGLFKRFWPSYYAPLARYWQPYMDGKGTLDGALTKCVDAIVGV